jgi:SNF2 family DNA or RNA helicase
VPIVVGYKNLQHFRDRIDPFFLGRAKHIVSDELPTLITKEVICELSPAEDAKYTEALSGVLELGDGEVKDFEEHKAFVSLIYCQQVCDSISLLRYEGGDEVLTGLYKDEGIKVKDMGSKEQTLLDMLADELDGEKTIIYTRFASLVPRLQAILKAQGIKSVAITGQVKDTEKNPARRKAQEAFQDMNSDVKVIFITDAGSEAINLQAASAMVFFDAPWSWGNYVQLLGRPIRIGSPHQHVVVYHLVAERPRDKAKDRKTIDHYTLDMLNKKKDLVDKVLGESAVGALDFEKDGSGTKQLVRKLQGKGT